MKLSPIALAVLSLSAMADQPSVPNPVTDMPMNYIYINNSRIPKGFVGRSYDAWVPESSFHPQGYDTPVPFGQTVVRPGNCNQVYTGTNPALFGTYACQRNAGNFRTFVAYTKMDYADPIVLPKQPGKSHLHTFFGNTGINAYSTNSPTDTVHSILNTGNSTASGGTLNRSAYWVPSMIYHCPTTFHDSGCAYEDDGTPITADLLNIYYKGSHGQGAWVNDGNNDAPWTATHDTEVYPQGFRMVAGNPSSTSDQGNIDFLCRAQDQNTQSPGYKHIPGTGLGATDACSTNYPTVATFTGSISGTVLTVTTPPSAGIRGGYLLTGAGITPGTLVLDSISTAGNGTGTYRVNFAQTVASEAMVQKMQWSNLRYTVIFPSCWNGVDVDSPSHNAHIIFDNGGANGSCPTGFTHPLVGISYQLEIYVTSAGIHRKDGKDISDMKYWRLSSDHYPDTQPAGYSMHGDWFNGWNIAVMTNWVNDCILPGMDCHDDLMGRDPTNTATPPNIFRRALLPRGDK